MNWLIWENIISVSLYLIPPSSYATSSLPLSSSWFTFTYFLLLLYASLLFTYLFCRNYSKLTKGTGGGSGAGKTKLDKERQKWLAKEMVSWFWYLIILTHCSIQSKWSLYCNICKVPIFFFTPGSSLYISFSVLIIKWLHRVRTTIIWSVNDTNILCPDSFCFINFFGRFLFLGKFYFILSVKSLGNLLRYFNNVNSFIIGKMYAKWI